MTVVSLAPRPADDRDRILEFCRLAHDLARMLALEPSALDAWDENAVAGAVEDVHAALCDLELRAAEAHWAEVRARQPIWEQAA